MKNLILLGCIQFVLSVSECQCLKLSGIVKPALQKVELNIPYDGHYYPINSLYQNANASGAFSFRIPGKQPKFVIFKYKTAQELLLLCPGRPLRICVSDNIKQQRFVYRGKGKVENELLRDLKVNDSLFFNKYKSNGTMYDKWSIDSVIRILLPIVRRQLEGRIQLVKRSRLPLMIKNALESELKYFYATQCLLYGESLYQYNGRKSKKEYYGVFTDTLLSYFNLPSKEDLMIGYSANIYLNDYTRYEIRKIMYNFHNDTNRAHAKIIIDSILQGTSLDQIEKASSTFGEGFAFVTLFDRHILPEYAWEKLMFNWLVYYCSVQDIGSAEQLQNCLENDFPTSQYLDLSQERIAVLRDLREKNSGNKNIVFRSDVITKGSLKSLMAPYIGKVVYLDIWGTWCGPCMTEMQFEASLEGHFKGQHVVFLFIDVDNDQFEDRWKNFVITNNLIGEHLRVPGSKIKDIWNDLGVSNAEQLYPYYCIFNTDGKVEVKDAYRPSTGKNLYDQISRVLNNHLN